MSKPNTKTSQSQHDSFYKKVSNQIYKEVVSTKEKIKANFLKSSNPILNLAPNAKENQNPIRKGKQSNRKNMTSDLSGIPAKSLGKMPTKNNENLFKTSYEAFFSKDKTEKERKKSTKGFVMNSLDFYSSHNNITGTFDKLKEDRVTPNGKKLFQPVYHKKSLVNMYRGDLDINTKSEAVQPEILHAFSTKKHFDTVDPSKETLWLNDKRKLLPSEVKQRHSRGNSVSANLLVKNRKNPNQESSKAKIEKSVDNNLKSRQDKRRRYPYAEDSIGKVFDLGNIHKEQYVTNKINKNSFNILKKVPRFDWEL